MSEDRRRLIGLTLFALGAVAVVVGLITVLTGDDDATETTTGSTIETETADEPASESTTSTTTTTTTSTTMSTTTTESPVDEVLEAARAAAGTYTGRWNNTTFGSTGPINVDMALDEIARVMTVTLDLGGNVFGGSDPDPVVVEIDIDNPSSSFTSELFGDVTISLEGSTLGLSAENIPAAGIATMTVAGTFDSSGSDLTYSIEFEGGGGAEGTSTLTRGPEPADDEDPAPVDDGGGAESLEGFFATYVAAIDAGDVDFLFDRLHPVVLAQPSADLCRAFIEREILALVDYRITGDVVGPSTETIAGSSVPDVFTVPTAFEFQGESFETNAVFALVDGQMHWFTECR